jgi:hypothetical protein
MRLMRCCGTVADNATAAATPHAREYFEIMSPVLLEKRDRAAADEYEANVEGQTGCARCACDPHVQTTAVHARRGL